MTDLKKALTAAIKAIRNARSAVCEAIWQADGAAWNAETTADGLVLARRVGKLDAHRDTLAALQSELRRTRQDVRREDERLGRKLARFEEAASVAGATRGRGQGVAR